MSAKSLEATDMSLTAGQLLAQARSAADISEREVSDALNLPIATIRAIENDDETQLPASVFSRGYVRAYAKLLELDPDEVIAALPAQMAEVEDSGDQGQAASARPAIDLQGLLQPKVVGAAAAALAIAIVVGWWLSSPGEDDALSDNAQVPMTEQPQASVASTSPSATDTEVLAPVDTPALVVEEIVEQTDETEIAIVSSEQDDALLESPSQPQGQSTPSSTDLTISPTAIEDTTPSTARRLTPTGDDLLHVEFTEECWVEIKSTDGTVLFADLGKPGEEMAFVGTAPYRVLLGYAPGALLKFNDGPVALSPHTRNNVASLVVGQ